MVGKILRYTQVEPTACYAHVADDSMQSEPDRPGAARRLTCGIALRTVCVL